MKTNQILKQLRQAKGLTQSEIAAELDVNISSYQKYEREKNSIMPSIDVLSKIADYYKVTVDYLLGRNESESSVLDKLSSEFNMSSLEKIITEEYLALPKSKREEMMNFLYKAVKRVEEDDYDNLSDDEMQKLYQEKQAALEKAENDFDVITEKIEKRQTQSLLNVTKES